VTRGYVFLSSFFVIDVLSCLEKILDAGVKLVRTVVEVNRAWPVSTPEL
jgi:hypothetical protein